MKRNYNFHKYSNALASNDEFFKPNRCTFHITNFVNWSMDSVEYIDEES